MLKVLKNFVRNEDGLEMVEWAVVAALVTSAGATAFTTLGGDLTAVLTAVSGIITGATP